MMFNISKAINERVANYTAGAIDRAEKKCLEARYFLNLFSETGKDKQLLLNALDLYVESIKIYSQQTEPYLAIGYICSVTGKLNDAQKLLNKAIEIDPFNTNARRMLNQVKSDIQNNKILPKEAREETKSLAEIQKKTKEIPKKSIFAKIAAIFLPRKNKIEIPETTLLQSSYAKDDFIAGLKHLQKQMHSNKIVVKVSNNTFSKIIDNEEHIYRAKHTDNILSSISLFDEDTVEPQEKGEKTEEIIPHLDTIKVKVSNETLSRFSRAFSDDQSHQEPQEELENLGINIPHLDTIKVKVSNETLSRFSRALSDESPAEPHVQLKNIAGNIPHRETIKVKVSEGTLARFKR